MSALPISLRWSAPLLLVASHATSGDWTGAVKVGALTLPPAQVEAALSACVKNAKERPADACINDYFVPRWLLDAEAQALNLKSAPAVRHVTRNLLHQALVRSLSEQVLSEQGSPSESQVKSYLEKHARDFQKPLRLRLFRLLFNDRAKAEETLAQLNGATDIETFRKLARENSVDRATKERGGDLGFVWPDGSTDVPEVRVEPALYQAAKALFDGQICPEVIPEGKRFAVLWRRGSLPEVPRDEASTELARVRVREAETEKALVSLLGRLKKDVSGRQSILLGKLRRKEATLFQEP